LRIKIVLTVPHDMWNEKIKGSYRKIADKETRIEVI